MPVLFMRLFVANWITGCLIFVVPAFAAAGGQTINVAVASNFLQAAREIARQYEQRSGNTVQLSSGSTGKLYAQIVNGAPFHLFLAADATRPEKLAQEGLAIAASRFTYAIGKLALWTVAPGISLEQGAAVLNTKSFRRLAIANPRTAPYGYAAEEFLEKYGVLEAVRSRLVMGENITQTYQFVMSGNAELGLVSYAQVMGKDMKGQVWIVPQEYYTPLVQQGIVLKMAADNAVVKAFVQYMQSAEVKTLLQDQYGYGV